MSDNRTRSDSATDARFRGAFPWFDNGHWAWHFESIAEGGNAYRIRGAPPDAFGEIAVYMPGATHEQCEAVTRWLIAEFNPAREVPGTRYIDMAKIGRRAGGHNSTMTDDLSDRLASR